eukprot:366491-Chlamydomonas_euryale.AAC.3
MRVCAKPGCAKHDGLCNACLCKAREGVQSSGQNFWASRLHTLNPENPRKSPKTFSMQERTELLWTLQPNPESVQVDGSDASIIPFTTSTHLARLVANRPSVVALPERLQRRRHGVVALCTPHFEQVARLGVERLRQRWCSQR